MPTSQGLFTDVVTEDGRLNDERIVCRETVYHGRNGRDVERFVLTAEDGPVSFIFKPATYPETATREVWVQDHLLPLVQGVRIPRILLTADSSNLTTYWSIMEDAGNLSHEFSRNDYLAAVRVMVRWHRLAADVVPNEFSAWTGNSLETIVSYIRDNWSITDSMERDFSLPSGFFQSVVACFRDIEGWNDEFVVSHGDYHIGNIGIFDGRLIVLDWENAHMDLPFCDLYSLLDKTHPEFPKQPIDNEFRVRALTLYAEEKRQFGGGCTSREFIKRYFSYSAVHSVWMLMLIWTDLRTGSWNTEHLLRQREETIDALTNCLRFLGLSTYGRRTLE